MKTIDYESFKILSTNRTVTQSHVTVLVNSMKKNGFLVSKPITVNNQMQIIDGQHRYLAAKELGLPIYFEIDNIDPNELMVDLNTTQNNWQLVDFVKHYSKMKVGYFTKLFNFIQDNKQFGVSAACIIFTGNHAHYTKNIREGVPMKEWENLSRCMDLLLFLKGKIKFYGNGEFVRSVCNLMNNKQIENKHVNKLKLNAYSIVQCARLDQYEEQFNALMKIKKLK